MTEELQKINEEASKFYNYEQAVKLMLNSIYGAFGNPYFYFFNVEFFISLMFNFLFLNLNVSQNMPNEKFVNFSL